MENKYNQINIEQYSRQLAKVFADHFFNANETVNGQQLIHFAPIKQVNLFLIKELLNQWHLEMANLKSPYFNFENEEVKEALVQFMNVLSRKILIHRPHFEPLLTKAIADTFYWTIDPVGTFEQKFLKDQSELSVATLNSQLKYISIDKELMRQFISSLPEGPLQQATVRNKFQTYIEEKKSERTGLDNVLTEFNALLPVKREDVLLNSPIPATPSPMRTIDELTISPERFAPQPPPAVPVNPAPVSQPQQVAPIREPAAIMPNGAESNLNERFKAERASTTLNERFVKPEPANIAHNQMSKKIESLKDSISINQRFSFINELFNGENIEYYQAIQTLDKFNDVATAKNYVTQDLSGRYNWSRKEEHINKLLRLIERKFADS